MGVFERIVLKEKNLSNPIALRRAKTIEVDCSEGSRVKAELVKTDLNACSNFRRKNSHLTAE